MTAQPTPHFPVTAWALSNTLFYQIWSYATLHLAVSNPIEFD